MKELTKLQEFAHNIVDATEVWLPVVGYEGHYKVSNMGRVFSLKRKTPHEMIGAISWRGYRRLVLCKNGVAMNITVHKIVAQAFLGHNHYKSLKIHIDHINNNRLDNRLSNLQLVSPRENYAKNPRKSTSKHLGVSFAKKRWIANIKHNGKPYYIGCFKTEEEAVFYYQQALKDAENGNNIKLVVRRQRKNI